jgi:hypothetical protein
MEIGEVVSLILSGLSLLVSGLALCVSWRNQRRIIQIEEARDKERGVEGKRARLKAYIEEKEYKVSGSIAIHRTHHLVVENEGSGEAHNVSLQMNGKSVPECAFIANAKEIRQIGPRSRFNYKLKGFAQDLPLDIHINWEDASEEPGDYVTKLTR